MLWVAEHGNIRQGSADRVVANGNLELRESSFNSVLSLLTSTDNHEDNANFEPIFKYGVYRGDPLLKVRNYVGLIRTKEGLHIEVLPKLAKNTEPRAARSLLIRMLIELEDSPFREANAAELNAHRMPLFEIVLRYFLNGVADIVRKGIARKYVDNEDNTPYLRGKLLIAKHIQLNAFATTHFYCAFDEYQGNRPINRLMRSALDIIAATTRDSRNKQQCLELLSWFTEIPPSADYALDFKRVQRERSVSHYMPTMPLCRLILDRLNPLTERGQSEAIAMLFPMERVFEDFVAAKLHKQFAGWRVQTQSRREALVNSHLGKPMFNLIPDLLVSKAGKSIVADTKWKLINERANSKKYDIAQSDIYQLFAYSKKCLKSSLHKEVYLIYPASDSFSKPLAPFWYEEDREVLYVVPFDLMAGKLLLPQGAALAS